MHQLRRPGPGPAGSSVRGLPSPRRRSGSEGAVSTVRQTRAHSSRDRLVWFVFSTRPAEGPPRICVVCGELRRHCGSGMCSRCCQRDPDRPLVRGANLIAELDEPPAWLADFVGFLAARHGPARAAGMIGALGRLLADEHPNHPQSVLERARRPGRSIGSLAHGLEDFFLERRLALPTDQITRLAAARRRSRIDAVPAPLRPAVRDSRRICCTTGRGPGRRGLDRAPTTLLSPRSPRSETWPCSSILTGTSGIGR